MLKVERAVKRDFQQKKRKKKRNPLPLSRMMLLDQQVSFVGPLNLYFLISSLPFQQASILLSLASTRLFPTEKNKK